MNTGKKSRKNRVKVSANKIRPKLAKLSKAVSILTERLEGIAKLIEGEEALIQETVKKRIDSVRRNLTRKIRELSAERRSARKFSRLVQNAKEQEKSGRKNSWTPDEISKMKDLLQTGVPVSEVANALGRKISAVRQRIFQEKISLRAIKKLLPPKPPSAVKGARGRRRSVVEVKPWEPEEIRNILGLLGSGMPLKEVAEKTGRTFQQIRQKLLLEGISLEDIRKGQGLDLETTAKEEIAGEGLGKFMEAIGGESPEAAVEGVNKEADGKEKDEEGLLEH